MERLSYSRLDLYRQCRRSFAMKYVHKTEPENSTTDCYADYGSLAHAILEQNSVSKGLLPQQFFMNMFLHGAENRSGRIKGFNEIQFPTFYGKNTMQDRYYEQGVEFVKRLPVRNTSRIIGVELEFNLILADDIPPVNGFIDQVERDEYGLIVTDFKSSKPYDQNKIDTALQMSVYGLACLDIFREAPHKYVYDFIRFNEQKETYRTMEQLQAAKQHIINTWRDIQNEQFDAQYDQFFCSNFCAYRVSCPLFQAKQQEAQQKRAAKGGAK